MDKTSENAVISTFSGISHFWLAIRNHFFGTQKCNFNFQFLLHFQKTSKKPCFQNLITNGFAFKKPMVFLLRNLWIIQFVEFSVIRFFSDRFHHLRTVHIRQNRKPVRVKESLTFLSGVLRLAELFFLLPVCRKMQVPECFGVILYRPDHNCTS